MALIAFRYEILQIIGLCIEFGINYRFLRNWEVVSRRERKIHSKADGKGLMSESRFLRGDLMPPKPIKLK